MRIFFLKSRRNRLYLASALALVPLLFFAWQRYFPAQSAVGWSFEVYRDGIPRVSALARDARDRLYVSQEYRNGRGVIFQLAPDGSRRDILTRLSKPDGIALYKDGIVASQEEGQKPLLLWSENKTEALPGANSIEGIVIDGSRLFAVEDVRKTGRLLEYDLEKKEMTVLREGLDEPEGIAVCPGGELFFTEKAKGWVKRYVPGANDDIVISGLREPGFLMCNDEGLWITEDSTHRARLLLWSATGKIRTILSYLRSPQTILPLDSGRFLLAEQGRERILELYRLADDQP
jgi:hypothetical protein